MYKNITLGFEFEIWGETEDIFNFIDNSSSITNIVEHEIHSYHGTAFRTKRGEWRVEHDGSLEHGAEFISPPFNYYKAKEICKKFFEVIKNTPHITTTKRCGLHVNMSIDGDINLNKIDMSNVLPNINYRLLYHLWKDRMSKNLYCKNLTHLLQTTEEVEDHRISIADLTANCLSNNRYAFIRLKTYNDKHYIEIRVPGGENYHLKFNDVFTTVDHIADVLLNNSNKPRSLKTTKKMYSYINRIHSNKCKQSPKFKLKHLKVSNDTIYMLYYSFKNKAFFIQNQREEERLYPSYYDTSYYERFGQSLLSNFYNGGTNFTGTKHYNCHNKITRYKKFVLTCTKDNFLYYLTRAIIYNEQTKYKIYNISNILKKNLESDQLMSIFTVPKNEKQIHLLKLLKSWRSLLPEFVIILMLHLHRRSLKFFLKYYVHKDNKETNEKWKTIKTIYRRNQHKEKLLCPSMNMNVLNASQK
ncbi:MAG: hypothetical protein GWP10_13570 [Nitrospiraceae bacterium]|nr:hypothetical protein [Nitrospiraceae bacterium]